MATDFNKLMLTHYTDTKIHVTPAEKNILTQDFITVKNKVTTLEADNLKVSTVLSDAIIAGSVYGEYINTDWLEAGEIIASAIQATYAYSQHVETEVANINSLFANYATIENLTATKAEIDTLLTNFIRADDIVATNLSVIELLAISANIQDLLAYQVNAQGIASVNITSDKLTIADGFINNAMILNLDAGKIVAGTIDTTKVGIQSENGNLAIIDNTIQIKDVANTVRVQIGKDANADYNMYVWDVNGLLMFDATGLTADGIKQPIIRDDMVSDNANINGSKINIASLITVINNGSSTIKASKILFDDTGQTLDVSFSSINSLISNVDSDLTALAQEVSVQGTAIGVINGQISSKVWQTDINTTVAPINSSLNNVITRISDAESTIVQNTTAIGLRVTTNTFTTQMATKEATILKQNTAPAHANGRLWLDTSVTPNRLKRSTGTAWVNATPTTATDVSAYSATAGSALEQGVIDARAYAETKATEAKNAAQSYALAEAEAKQLLAQAYADGIVDDEESARITDVNAKLATAKTYAETKASEAQAAAKTYTDTSVVSITNRVSAAELKITDDAIISTVLTSTDYTNALGEKVSTSNVISSINQSAEEIKIDANKVNITGFVTFESLSTQGQTTINAGNIATGILQSANYVVNTTGTKISLVDGAIDTKYFKLSSAGVITATSGTLENMTVKGNIYIDNGLVMWFPEETETLTPAGYRTVFEAGRYSDFYDVFCYETVRFQKAVHIERQVYMRDALNVSGVFSVHSGYATINNSTGAGTLMMGANSGIQGTALGQAIIASGATDIYLRPNGFASSVGQVQISTNGSMTVNGNLGVTGAIFTDQLVYCKAGGSTNLRLTYTGDGAIHGFNRGGAEYMHITTSSGAYGVAWWLSDARLKDNIVDTEVNGLSIVNQLNHRAFKWNELSDTPDKQEPIGYVAQELEQINEDFVFKIPQLNDPDDNNSGISHYSYQVNQNKIIPYITKSIQELHGMLLEAQAEITRLKALMG